MLVASAPDIATATSFRTPGGRQRRSGCPWDDRQLQPLAGSAEIGASVAAEAPVEEPVGHEVEQVSVHLIPAPVGFVCDPHEVFDDGRHLLRVRQ